MTKKQYDQVGAIIAYETGELSARLTLVLFAHLINTGLAWSLQGHYGRAAAALQERGLVRKNTRGRWVPDYERLEELEAEA